MLQNLKIEFWLPIKTSIIFYFSLWENVSWVWLKSDFADGTKIK